MDKKYEQNKTAQGTQGFYKQIIILVLKVPYFTMCYYQLSDLWKYINPLATKLPPSPFTHWTARPFLFVFNAI